MKVVLDANCIINKAIPASEIAEAFITSSVLEEIKDRASVEYLHMHGFLVTERNPKDEYVKLVLERTKDRLLYLSSTDIEVVALTLEISEELEGCWISAENINDLPAVLCLSKDNAVINALNMFNLINDTSYQDKKFKLRCYACTAMYDSHVDFCKHCGYNTITRVSVVNEDGKEKVLLKKNYTFKPKIIKNAKGVPIISADQKEYAEYLNQQKKAQKIKSNLNFLG